MKALGRICCNLVNLTVKLHVPRIDTRTVNPRVVEVVLASFYEQNFQVMIQVRKAPSYHAATAAATTNNDIKLVWNRHDCTMIQFLICNFAHTKEI